MPIIWLKIRVAKSTGSENVRKRTCTGSESVGREQVRLRKCMGREKVSREKTNTPIETPGSAGTGSFRP